MVDGGGERTFVSGRGAETTLGPADLADLELVTGDVVLVSGYGLDDALADWVSRDCAPTSRWYSTLVRSPGRGRSPGCGPGWTG